MSLIGILLMSMVVACRENPDDLSQNKKVVSDYMAGFNAGDHQLILSCLTDDVVWECLVCIIIQVKLHLIKKLKTRHLKAGQL